MLSNAHLFWGMNKLLSVPLHMIYYVKNNFNYLLNLLHTYYMYKWLRDKFISTILEPLWSIKFKPSISLLYVLCFMHIVGTLRVYSVQLTKDSIRCININENFIILCELWAKHFYWITHAVQQSVVYARYLRARLYDEHNICRPRIRDPGFLKQRFGQWRSQDGGRGIRGHDSLFPRNNQNECINNKICNKKKKTRNM